MAKASALTLSNNQPLARHPRESEPLPFAELMRRTDVSLAEYADSSEDLSPEAYQLLVEAGPLLLALDSANHEVRHAAVARLRGVAKRYTALVVREAGVR